MRHSIPVLLLLLTIPALAGPRKKAPVIQATLQASVLFGPGHEPLPGSPPFRPNLDCVIHFQAAPPRNMKVRLFLLPVASDTGSTRPPSAVKGSKPLAHRTLSTEGGTRTLRAEWPQGFQDEHWRAAVEFQVGGQHRGHATAAIKAHFLPAAPPRGGGPEQEN